MRESISKIGTITKLDIKIEHTSGGGRGGGGGGGGGGGITKTVLAEYSYTVNGIKYNGSRPSIHSGGDNIGNFQRKLYNRLKKNIDENMQITVYINPNNPSMSCLDLTIDPLRTILQILFPIPFLCISLVSLLQFLKIRNIKNTNIVKKMSMYKYFIFKCIFKSIIGHYLK